MHMERLLPRMLIPLNKKPLYHFLPGTRSFSIAAAGCNFRCGFCQNWQISQVSHRDKTAGPGQALSPRDVVRTAIENRCQSISYTYTEPTIFFEYAHDIAQLARDAGLLNVFVTNGYMTSEALVKIKPFLNACNVDLKAFSDDTYRKVCHAKLQPVLDSIRMMKELNIWVEITTLVVPGLNDSEEELNSIARFIAGIDQNIPWHISRYHPDFQFTEAAATPVEVLSRASALGAEAGLRYIYVGNVIGEHEETFCPNCHKILLKRQGFLVAANILQNANCPDCNEHIAGIF
jgi:pyruvate formate lyase activating enzyme